TANAWPAAERRTGAVAIYTRGRQAEETAARPVASVPARLRGYVPLDEGAAVQLVGTCDGAPLSLDTLLRTEPPAGQGGLVRPGAVLLADLTEVHPSYAYRLLLRGLPVRRAVFAVSAQARKLGLYAADHPVWRLVGAVARAMLAAVAVPEPVSDIVPAQPIVKHS